MSSPSSSFVANLGVVLLLLFWVTPTLAQSTPLERPPMRWKSKQWKLGVHSHSFSSTANYDIQRGLFERLPNGNSYQVMEAGLRARYGTLKNTFFYGGLDFARARSAGSTLERTNAALTDLVAGVDLLFPHRWAQLVAEIEGSVAMDQASAGRTTVLTNDGVHYVRGLIFATKSLGSFNLQAHGGLTYRMGGLSTLFHWGLGTELPFEKRFLIGGGFEGYETVIGDSQTPDQRRVVTTRVNAGSNAFYAFDPALIEAKSWFGWNPLDAWQLRAGIGSTLNGVRAASGMTFFLNISYDLDVKPDRSSFRSFDASRERIRRKTKKAVKEFEIEEEKVDPDLFDDDDGFEPDSGSL